MNGQHAANKEIHFILTELSEEYDLPYSTVEELTFTWDTEKSDRILQTCPYCEREINTD